MKKIFCLVLSLIIIASLASCGGNSDTPTSSEENGNSNLAAEQQDGNDIEITVENVMAHEVSPESDFETTIAYGYGEALSDIDESNSVVITGYTGNDDIVVIPETIDGKSVVAIDGYAFGTEETKVKAVKLSNSVELIQRVAFVNNKSTEIVVCGNGLKTIEKEAFWFCENLREVVLDDGLESIEKSAFQYTDITEITIPESVTEIGDGAFDYEIKIKGKEGSAAEEYAKNREITFESID